MATDRVTYLKQQPLPLPKLLRTPLFPWQGEVAKGHPHASQKEDNKESIAWDVISWNSRTVTTSSVSDAFRFSHLLNKKNYKPSLHFPQIPIEERFRSIAISASLSHWRSMKGIFLPIWWRFFGVITSPTQTMHYYRGNPSKLPYIYIVWLPPHGGNWMTPLLSIKKLVGFLEKPLGFFYQY